jgi:hypothetical protein
MEKEQRAVPRYFFAVVNGHRLPDPSGVECPDDEHARIQAKQIARQIAVEVPTSIQRRHISVTDTGGREIALIEVGE